METIAYSFHDEKRVLDDKYLKAGDDAKSVKWLEITSDLKLFASHKDFIKKVVDMHNASWDHSDNKLKSSSSNNLKSSLSNNNGSTSNLDKNTKLSSSSRTSLTNRTHGDESSNVKSSSNENNSRVCVRS
jgi:hypothetical protein